MVIDDLASRCHDCDLLVDQTVGRARDDYRGLVPDDAELLIGSDYALLRPAFAALRPEAIARRQNSAVVRRILISLGMTDVGGMTVSAIEQTLAAIPGCAIDVVIGSAAPSFEQVQALAARHDLVTLHVDSDRMCELMAAADLAVGAAGTTSWERCCLGLPTVTLVVSPNQRTIARKLVEAGAIDLVATAKDDIASALQRLAAHSPLRAEMTSNSLRLCDGEGTRRVANRLLSARSAPSDPGQVSWNR
jgi:UDP-2,4-diacetamido-2,4,6-trideoxy-beta-L-altropyranose hydrolase